MCIIIIVLVTGIYRHPCSFNIMQNTIIIIEIDECDDANCGVGDCIDLINDYECECPLGYYFDDVTCQGIPILLIRILVLHTQYNIH